MRLNKMKTKGINNLYKQRNKAQKSLAFKNVLLYLRGEAAHSNRCVS